MPEQETDSSQRALETKLEKFLSPLEYFIRKQTTASILLLLSLALALIIANSPLSFAFEEISASELGFVFRDWKFSLSLKNWVGDGLMTLFFFMIGLEVKREILAGKLSDPRQVTLILMAAVGGMIFPAAIYGAINFDTSGAHGWAIPMATDTAFALGVLSLLARRVSPSAAIFLAAMAIFDDIGAIVIISLFYGHAVALELIVYAACILSFLLFLNILGVRNGWIYTVLGILLWFIVYHSGMHATLTGLLMAAIVPARTRLGGRGFIDKMQILLSTFEKERHAHGGILSAPLQHTATSRIGDVVRAASTPLQRWETSLVWPIGMIVLPLFAIFNAGILLTWDGVLASASSPVAQGIIAGLVIGKPLGIVSMVALGVKIKAGELPKGMRFFEVVAIGILAGIGFTMSLFITMLSFENQPDKMILITDAKTGILLSSFLSAIMAVILLSLPRNLVQRRSEKV